MNAYVEKQTSGNDWASPLMTAAYQEHQETVATPLPKDQTSILEGLEQQMLQFEAEQETTIGQIARNYVMPRDSSVRIFFKGHRSIPELLLEAAPYLKQHFGENTVFTLRAPVDEAGSQTLYAVAGWPGKIREAREALNGFDKEWWMARAGQAGGHLTFTYELT